ncbi:MAG: aminotransferase class IV [Pirellulales bacterium]|nr:aminotransferase class IV [Pirellulales bacterium]
MNEPWVYLNGKWLAASKAALSLTDAGFVLGATIAEQVRTFHGKIFRLDDHLARLEHSLQLVGIDPQLERGKLAELAREIVARNHRLLELGDDLGLSIFVTPGQYPAYSAAPEPTPPTVCLHTYPLPFRYWAEKYRAGQFLATTGVRQVPPECWPVEIKCRSRMHFFLADRQAARNHPGSRAVLLDRDGNVTEASTANVLLYRRDEGLISPPAHKILHGISLMELFDLASALQIPCVERDFTPQEAAAADEVLLSSTPFCVLPCTRFNGQPIAAGRPGTIYSRLLASWSELVGVDIIHQSERFCAR